MNIFEATDFRDYLKFRVNERLFSAKGQKKSSLRRVANELGYSAASMLSMVLNGKRIPSESFCEAAARSWKLSNKERDYLRLLVQLERRKKLNQDTTETVKELQRLVGKRQVNVFKETDFSPIREWHYAVLKQVVESPSFREDPVWLAKKLRRKVTPSQALAALEKLEHLGLLVRDPVTRRLKSQECHDESTHDIPSSAIRQHHREMIQRSLEALEDRPVEERFFNSLTFNLDPARLPDLRKRLLDFMREISTEYGAQSTDSIYQLNLNLFEHTLTLHPEKNRGTK